MKVIEPSYVIETDISDELNDFVLPLEKIGRTCYRSEGSIGDAKKSREFIRRIVRSGHTSILDHAYITVRFICNRGFTHELVRHRLAAYAQESTRYCNYSKDRFDRELTFIKPLYFEKDTVEYITWETAMANAEASYMYLVTGLAVPPEQARGVLPIDIRTEIVITANITEWRHIFKLRLDPKAHPQMIQLMGPLYLEFKEKLPTLFDEYNFKNL